MHTHRQAFIAGGNNIVKLLRGQPQFCGQRGYMEEMLLLYMFITLPWKNKSRSHRHFLGSSLLSHLSGPVWEGGRPWARHMSHFIIFRNRHPNFSPSPCTSSITDLPLTSWLQLTQSITHICNMYYLDLCWEMLILLHRHRTTKKHPREKSTLI